MAEKQLDAVDSLLSPRRRAGPIQRPKRPGDAVDRLLGAPTSGASAKQRVERQKETAGPNILHRAYNMMTGKGQAEFDLPELGTSGPAVDPLSKEGLRMMAAYATSIDPQGVADIAVKTLPGASTSQDNQGNPIVSFRGKDYYVNKPGVSQADLFQLLAQSGAFAPAARIAQGGRLAWQMGKMGILSGLTSMGSDVAAQELGSEQPIDYGRAAVTGAAGAAFTGLSPLAERAWRAILGKSRLFNPATRKLTKEGRKAAEDAGLNPEDLTDDAARYFAQEARRSTDPKTARGLAESREFGIPFTRGQTTRNYRELSREEATRHGSFGDDAGDIMRAFDREQREAIEAAGTRVQGRLAGGAPSIARPAQAGEPIRTGVEKVAEAGKAGISAAYKTAGEGEARLTVGGLTALSKRAAEAVRKYGLDPQLFPAATKGMKNIGRLSRQSKRFTAITLKRLETERRKLLALEKAALNNPADKSAVTDIRRALDDWLDEAVDDALFSGDPDALDLLKTARGLRRQYGLLFEPQGKGDDVGKIVEKILSTNPTPEQTMNYIIGAGKLGGKAGAAKVVKRMEKILGPDSEEFNMLREAVWLRLTRDASNKARTPIMISKQFNEAFTQNRSLLEALYSKPEMALMERYKSALVRTITPEEARNPSRTAYTMARLMREMAGRVGTMMTFSGSPLGGATFFTMKRIPSVMGKRAARKAVAGFRPEPRTVPGIGAPAAAVSGQLDDDLDRLRNQPLMQ